MQVDVTAVNWQERQILLGECKWGDRAVNRQVARELIEQKTPRLLRDLPGEGRGWQAHYAVFSRTGLTTAVAGELRACHGLDVNLAALAAQLDG